MVTVDISGTSLRWWFSNFTFVRWSWWCHLHHWQSSGVIPVQPGLDADNSTMVAVCLGIIFRSLRKAKPVAKTAGHSPVWTAIQLKDVIQKQTRTFEDQVFAESMHPLEDFYPWEKTCRFCTSYLWHPRGVLWSTSRRIEDSNTQLQHGPPSYSKFGS